MDNIEDATSESAERQLPSLNCDIVNTVSGQTSGPNFKRSLTSTIDDLEISAVTEELLPSVETFALPGKRRKESHREKRERKKTANPEPKASPVDDRDRPDNYHPINKDNPRIRKYVKSLGLIPDEEWDLFWETLKEPLPSSFRVTGFRRDCEALKKVIQNHFLAELPEETAKLCQQITWYPENLAWQINMHRRHMRRNDELKPLREFIINETASGNISRQETVSMLPPVLLNVKPGMKVLDMCAAPGSKTAQIVDMIQGDLRIDNLEDNEGSVSVTDFSSDGFSSDSRTQIKCPLFPDGLVVANDAEYKRCQLLTHQIKRLQSPCVIVTNHDATCMPNILIGPEGIPVAFDRVLCDVPCSGDGTIRKNLDLWRTFHPNQALSLHPVQYRILKRGLELLAIGGRLVYSTCSMNPVENEAVLCRILNETDHSVELVDCNTRLPTLKRLPGMTSWKVMSGSDDLYETHANVPPHLKMKVRVEFFPPPNAQSLHLDRCIRIMPHFQNTGGFFVAVLEKKSTLPWQKYAPLSQVRVKSQRIFEDEPLVPFVENDSVNWNLVKDFFSIHQAFPAEQLFIRKNDQEKSRHVYAVSKVVKDVLQFNGDHLRIVNAGVRILTRLGVHESVCPYRLSQEGLQVWMDFLTLPKITMTKEELGIMFAKDFIELKALNSGVLESAEKVPIGSVIVRYEKPGGLIFDLAAWRAATTIRCYVAKEERGHYLRLLQMENAPPRPPGDLI